jgi:hypothetical protein
MSKHKIINISDHVSPWEMINTLQNKGVNIGDSFRVKVKGNGKRAKLKRLRYVSSGHYNCESCGSYSSIDFSRGGGKYHYNFDNHLGNFNCADIAKLIMETEK